MTNSLLLIGYASGEEDILKSEENLLETLLANDKYKHSKHLRFLANQHMQEIMKIRFVLHPFAFLFLLEGEQMYHIVMETLDTEEASYMWHIEKSIDKLKDAMQHINNDLNQISIKGRKAFTMNSPSNFSRVIHDYKDQKIGFYNWKAVLETKLF